MWWRACAAERRKGAPARRELDANNAARGPAIQIVFQDPFSALDPRMPVSDIIAEPLRIQGIGTKNERRARAAALSTRSACRRTR